MPKASLWGRHPLGEPEQVTDACIDMSPSFIAGMMEHFPETSITFDKFHVVKLLNEAMNEVRKAEARSKGIPRMNTPF